MFRWNTKARLVDSPNKISLNSTMFRWNFSNFFANCLLILCLNSTMFRWNKNNFLSINIFKISFKFHYVQMKQLASELFDGKFEKFKFHYVQMKQGVVNMRWIDIDSLNSTMFRWNFLKFLKKTKRRCGLNSTMFRWNFFLVLMFTNFFSV